MKINIPDKIKKHINIIYLLVPLSQWSKWLYSELQDGGLHRCLTLSYDNFTLDDYIYWCKSDISGVLFILFAVANVIYRIVKNKHTLLQNILIDIGLAVLVLIINIIMI